MKQCSHENANFELNKRKQQNNNVEFRTLGFFFFKIDFYLYSCIFACAYVCVYVLSALGGQEEGVGSSGNKIKDGCEPPC